MNKYTLQKLLAVTLQKYPDNKAFGYAGKEMMTYRQFGEKVEEIKLMLAGAGVKKGDRVALLSENMPNWPVCYFAVTTMGAIIVPVMYDFSSVEIDYILRHAAVKILFISSKLLPKIEHDDYPALERKILTDDFSEVEKDTNTGFLKTLTGEGKKGLEKLKGAVLKAMGTITEEPLDDDPASLIYTSGTTGHSKGVMLTHKNIVANVHSTIKMSGVNEKDIMLSILPLAHTFECTLGMLTPVFAGGSVCYLNGLPVPAVLLPALKEVKPTVMMSVPLIMEKIYKNKIAPSFKKSAILRTLYSTSFFRKKLNKIAGKKLKETFGGRMRLFCIGGAPLAEDVEEFLHEAKFPYSVGYGLTETSPLVTGNPAETYKLKTVGRPIPGVLVKILEEDPVTQVGEVGVKGENVMKMYYEDMDRTREVFNADGWFKTGDLGFLDDEGYLHIKGRSKNMILGPNGKNIYPEEIEARINESEKVLESLVFERDGRIMAKVHFDYKALDEAFTELKLNVEQSRAEIQRSLKRIKEEVNHRIPSYAQIAALIEQTDPFEKTPTLKIKRYLYE